MRQVKVPSRRQSLSPEMLSTMIVALRKSQMIPQLGDPVSMSIPSTTAYKQLMHAVYREHWFGQHVREEEIRKAILQHKVLIVQPWNFN